MKTRKKRIILTLAIVGAILMIGISGAQAAPTVRLDPLNNTVALGIDNLVVNSTLYNVDFIFTDADRLYGFPKVWDFDTEATALAAVDAVNTALNDYNSVSSVDVVLLGDKLTGQPPVPDPQNFFLIGFNEAGGRTDHGNGDYGGGTWFNDGVFNGLSFNNNTYADFTVVPIPAAAWLLGGGLIGLLGLRKRFKR